MQADTAFDNAVHLHQAGQLRAAYEAYEALLKISPDHIGAWHYSGLVLFQSGYLEQAHARLLKALQRDQHRPDLWLDMARVCQRLGRYQDFLGALAKVGELAAYDGEIWDRKAALELSARRFAAAEVSAVRATRFNPQLGSAWFHLAQARQGLGQLHHALRTAKRAIALLDNQVIGVGFTAQLHAQLGNRAMARVGLEQGLRQFPTELGLLYQLAELNETENRFEDAADLYRRIVQTVPTQGAALAQELFLRKRLGDWRSLPALRQQFIDGLAQELPMLTPFSLLSDPSTRAQQQLAARLWSRQFPADYPAPPLPDEAGVSRPLRIGYLSSDFHQHATTLLTAGLFESHDRAAFEVFGYSTGRDDGSALRARVVQAFDHFSDAFSWAPQRLAQRIAADGIDILIDLKGHTENAATVVMALRPAPIQVQYLGYPGTLGSRFIDYLIGDPTVTPLAHAADYDETLALLPHSYQVNDRKRQIADALPTRAELGLPDNAVVLCSFNNSYKFNPEVFDVWAEILAAAPESVLWLLAKDDNDPLIANLRREIAARGIDPARLHFASFRANPDYMALYYQADLFLDTWPYNAHTTASDALWAACPVLTLQGETFASRVAASLLNAVHLPELITHSPEQYRAQALKLIADKDERRRLRLYLAKEGRQTPLFDTQATTRALESAYQTMVQQRRRGEKQAFIVTEPS